MQSSGNSALTRPSKRVTRMRALMVISPIVLIILLLVIFFLFQWTSDRNRAYQTSHVVIAQVERIIDNNKEKEEAIVESLKEDYITRSRSISYMLDHHPESISDVTKLREIADLFEVDEIDLFDESGTIFSSTVPSYLGYTLDSGEQIAYFKPMLYDKSLVMCQDLTENTADNKLMMYAMCWNPAGTRMTQVGIEPTRLIEEMHSSEMADVVDSMPSYSGLSIFVANSETGKIEGATDNGLIGTTLAENGIDLSGKDTSSVLEFEADVAGMPSYCSAHTVSNHTIVVTQTLQATHDGIIHTMAMLAGCMLIASIFFVVIVRRLARIVVDERVNATTDSITGLLNRRAYEQALVERGDGPEEKSLVYISIDLNGLKKVNDTLGHAEGDRLIQGIAECMRCSFKGYGNLYRIGGDEFAALIYADDDTLNAILRDFEDQQTQWSKDNELQLTASCGCASVREHPDLPLDELAKIADTLMYEAKDRHYKRNQQ